MATHPYPVNVKWNGGKEGAGTVSLTQGGEELPLAVPPEYGGNGQATNPEELLTAAITACYSMTFGIIAGNRKLPVTAIHVDSVGEVEQVGASLTYKKITIKPKITLDPSATDEQVTIATDMAHKADLYCPITNAVRGKVEVTVEPEVLKG
jgi:peroxiredoxin-like protein